MIRSPSQQFMWKPIHKGSIFEGKLLKIHVITTILDRYHILGIESLLIKFELNVKLGFPVYFEIV